VPVRWRWALALAALGLLLSSDAVRTYWKRKVTLGRLEKSLSELRRKNQALEDEVRRLKTDPRLMERHARRELGLIQPGEIEYRFIKEK
jgi:cell division protein FtsB